MTLLVTGVTGHVGNCVARTAAARGMSVVATHRGETPSSIDGITWVPCDLADTDAVAGLAAEHPVETCIHAEAVSNEAYARPVPLATITANINATASLLETARVNDWRRFVLVSTGSVFQVREDTTSPVPEEAPPEPRNIYSTTKTAAEMLAAMYRSEFGLSAAAVRLSWVYGPPFAADNPARGPIPGYLLRTLKGEAIREGGADFAASFTYVQDAADGLLAAATAETLNYGIYHLGPGENFPLARLADAARAAVPGAVIELQPGTEPLDALHRHARPACRNVAEGGHGLRALLHAGSRRCGLCRLAARQRRHGLTHYREPPDKTALKPA